MIETQSATWQAIVEACEKHISEAQLRLEAHGRDLGTTEYERGKIAALRRILSLANPPRPVPTPPPNSGFAGF